MRFRAYYRRGSRSRCMRRCPRRSCTGNERKGERTPGERPGGVRPVKPPQRTSLARAGGCPQQPTNRPDLSPVHRRCERRARLPAGASRHKRKCTKPIDLSHAQRYKRTKRTQPDHQYRQHESTRLYQSRLLQPRRACRAQITDLTGEHKALHPQII